MVYFIIVFICFVLGTYTYFMNLGKRTKDLVLTCTKKEIIEMFKKKKKNLDLSKFSIETYEYSVQIILLKLIHDIDVMGTDDVLEEK